MRTFVTLPLPPPIPNRMLFVMSVDPAANTPAPAAQPASAGCAPLPPCAKNHYALLALALLLLVGYGSLIPLKFHVTPPRDFNLIKSAAWMWNQIQLPGWITDEPSETSPLGLTSHVSDIITNLALYFPVALLLNLALHRRGLRHATSAVLAIAIVTLTSYALESAQSIMAFRISSLNDVALNALGGTLGALLAFPIHRAARRLAFKLYCLTAHHLHIARDRVRALQSRPALLIVIIVTNLFFAFAWLYDAAHHDPTPQHPAANWLPFYTQWLKPYDLAALQIARSLAIYGGISLILAVQLLPTRSRPAVAAIALLTGLLVATREFLFTHHRGPDITEPLLALLAAGLIASAIALTRHAVQSSSRRKQPAPIPADSDRRRRQHEYKSA